jgi:7,8-dihydroneopterin aldolase/epimerase/oxygenase
MSTAGAYETSMGTGGAPIPSDRILLSGLRVRGHHGVLPHEAQIGQVFVVDLELAVDLAAAGRADDLDRTVDYGSLAGRVAELVGGRPRTWPSWSWPTSGSARSGSA